MSMTDNSERTETAVAEEEPKAPTMAETDEPQQQEKQDVKKPDKISASFSIWPPTQRTRDAIINRLIENLSTPSILSKRYGTLPQEEASDAARRIEDEAFSAAAGSTSADDDGIEILGIYSKEISKRMLEVVKSRSATASAPDSSNASQSSSVASVTPASEEISSVKTES